jgi:hypothetical protein
MLCTDNIQRDDDIELNRIINCTIEFQVSFQLHITMCINNVEGAFLFGFNLLKRLFKVRYLSMNRNVHTSIFESQNILI